MCTRVWVLGLGLAFGVATVAPASVGALSYGRDPVEARRSGRGPRKLAPLRRSDRGAAGGGAGYAGLVGLVAAPRPHRAGRALGVVGGAGGAAPSFGQRSLVPSSQPPHKPPPTARTRAHLSRLGADVR